MRSTQSERHAVIFLLKKIDTMGPETYDEVSYSQEILTRTYLDSEFMDVTHIYLNFCEIEFFGCHNKKLQNFMRDF